MACRLTLAALLKDQGSVEGACTWGQECKAKPTLQGL